ncbi:MAG: DUF1822 family protein [Cuspidothrix sp.]
MFDLNQLLTDNTQYLRLDILPSVQEKAWEQSQKHSNAIARHNSYLNYVSLYTLLDWFIDDLTEAETIAKPEIYPSEHSLPSIWEVVNGAVIKLGEKRIVLIPCEISDLEEFSVPQEWVDIPEWAGDYYLAIQVNLEPEEDECWLELCGFTTHRYLKNLSKYNPNERIYTMTLDNLIQDIAVMEITLPLKMQEEIPDLPKLSEIKAKKWLDFFGNSSIYSPRLRVDDVTFEEWAVLLVNDLWRQQLYEQRMGLVTSASLVAGNAPTPIASLSITLGEGILKRIQNTLLTICQKVEPLLKQSSGELILGFKNAPNPSITGFKGTNFVTIELPTISQEIALTVALIPVKNESEVIDVLVEVRPVENQQTLLPNLEFKVLNPNQGTIVATQSEEKRPFIFCKFRRKLQEPFSVHLALNNWKHHQIYSSVNNSLYLI